MNARTTTPAPTTMPQGMGTYLHFFATPTLTVPANEHGLLVFNAWGTDAVARYWTQSSLSAPPVMVAEYNTAVIYTPPPEDFSARRGTVELTDITPLMSRGGVVRVLNTPQSIPSLMSSQIFVDVRDLTITDPLARSFGSELSTTHAWDTHVVSFGRYETFRDVASSPLHTMTDDPALSTIVIYFEPYASARTFIFGHGVGAYARYASSSVLQRQAREMPVAPLQAFIAANRALARRGGQPTRVGNSGGQRGGRRSGPRASGVPQPRLAVGPGLWA